MISPSPYMNMKPRGWRRDKMPMILLRPVDMITKKTTHKPTRPIHLSESDNVFDGLFEISSNELSERIS